MGQLTETLPGETACTELLRRQAAARPRSRAGVVFGRTPLGPDAVQLYESVVGQRAVAARLAHLGPEWLVLHSVAVGAKAGRADHLVVGPGGVVTVSSLHVPLKDVWVGGNELFVARSKRPDIKVAEGLAQRVTSALGAASGQRTEAAPVIAVGEHKRFIVRNKPTTVTALRAARLVRWILARPEALTGPALAAVQAAAVSPDTWTGATTPLTPEQRAEQEAEFDRLHRDVRSARRRKNLWTFGTVLVVFTGILAALQGFALGYF